MFILVIKEGLVAQCVAIIRERVRNDLLIGIRRRIRVVIGVAKSFLPAIMSENGDVRHFITVQEPAVGDRRGRRCRKTANLSLPSLILTTSPSCHIGLVVVRRRGGKTGDIHGISALRSRDGATIVCLVCQRTLRCSVRNPRRLRGFGCAHSSK